MISLMKKQTGFSIWAKFIKEHWGVYSVGVLTVLLTDLCQVLSALSLGWILDFFTKGKELPSLFQGMSEERTFSSLFWTLVASYVFLTLGRIGWRLTMARKTHVAAAMLKRKIWDRARFFRSIDLQEKWSKGVLMNATNSDVNSARFIFGFTLVAVIDVIFLGIFTLWAMFSINVHLTLWSLATLLFLPVVVRKLTEKEMQRYEKAQDALSSFNDLSSQVISTIRLQRLTQTGAFWEKKLSESAESYRQDRLKAVNTSLMFIPAMGAGSLLSFVILFALGIPFVMNGVMSIGDFVAMQGLIFLLQQPLMELGYIISDGRKGQTSLNRLNRIYTERIEDSLVADGEAVEEQEEILCLDNVSFSYSEDSALVNNLSLTLKKGERLGILGPIGTGKTTLVNLMSGLIRNHEGEILLCGKKYDEYSHSHLRSYISIVGQRPFLFADSIKKNLSMDLELTDEQCWHFLELAGLKEDVQKFDHQLETSLGEWGINLSGGQKQRLTLARALARSPKLLFLDDCLSAVDTVTEDKILKNLDRELKGVTLVWVAHRSSTLKYCDRLLELEEKSSSDQYPEVSSTEADLEIQI